MIGSVIFCHLNSIYIASYEHVLRGYSFLQVASFTLQNQLNVTEAKHTYYFYYKMLSFTFHR